VARQGGVVVQAGVGVGLRTGQDPQSRHSGSMTWTLKP
jgi:hypothetical protein